MRTATVLANSVWLGKKLKLDFSLLSHNLSYFFASTTAVLDQTMQQLAGISWPAKKSAISLPIQPSTKSISSLNFECEQHHESECKGKKGSSSQRIRRRNPENMANRRGMFLPGKKEKTLILFTINPSWILLAIYLWHALMYLGFIAIIIASISIQKQPNQSFYEQTCSSSS